MRILEVCVCTFDLDAKRFDACRLILCFALLLSDDALSFLTLLACFLIRGGIKLLSTPGVRMRLLHTLQTRSYHVNSICISIQ